MKIKQLSILAVAGLLIAATAALPGDSALATGNSITAPDGPGAVGGSSSLELDPNGFPVVSYHDIGNDDLKVLHCGDPDCAMSSSWTIASPDVAGDVGKNSSLTLNSSGNPVISYWDETNDDLKILRCGNASCTSGNSIIAADTAGNVGLWSSIAVNGLGNPVVAYLDGSNADLKVLRCGTGSCSAGNSISSPDVAGQVGGWPSLQLDTFGNPVVSYYDYTNLDLKVLHCGNPECTAGNSVTSPDTALAVGGDTSLALDASGNPVVSYRDFGNSDLKVLHCGDPTCSSGNSIAAPATGTDSTSARNMSLQLDASGNPVISYFDNTNDDLKVLHCGNVNCTAGNSITLPDTAGFVGEMSSLVLDGFGNPVVSYFDLTNYDLKVLHCSDATCAGVKTVDTDGDGCPDIKEQQNAIGSQTSGGRRDYTNAYDYFNPTHDGQNRVDDILIVADQYFKDDNDGNPGFPPYAPGYTSDTDRTDDPSSLEAWDLWGPDGLQRVEDILFQAKQYFHDCS